jgi:hypothetical protein
MPSPQISTSAEARHAHTATATSFGCAQIHPGELGQSVAPVHGLVHTPRPGATSRQSRD